MLTMKLASFSLPAKHWIVLSVVLIATTGCSASLVDAGDGSATPVLAPLTDNIFAKKGFSFSAARDVPAKGDEKTNTVVVNSSNDSSPYTHRDITVETSDQGLIESGHSASVALVPAGGGRDTSNVINNLLRMDGADTKSDRVQTSEGITSSFYAWIANTTIDEFDPALITTVLDTTFFDAQYPGEHNYGVERFFSSVDSTLSKVTGFGGARLQQANSILAAFELPDHGEEQTRLSDSSKYSEVTPDTDTASVMTSCDSYGFIYQPWGGTVYCTKIPQLNGTWVAI